MSISVSHQIYSVPPKKPSFELTYCTEKQSVLLHCDYIQVMLVLILILSVALGLVTRCSTLGPISSVNGYIARAEIDLPRVRNDVSVLVVMSRYILRRQIPERMNPSAERLRHNSFEILLLADPVQKLIDLEVLRLNFQAILQIVVEAVSLGVEEGEDLRTAHEAEQVRKQIWVCVHEVAAIDLNAPGVIF
jgi:hypothetical protein